MFTTGPIRYFYTSHKCFLGLMHWASKDSQFWESEQKKLENPKVQPKSKIPCWGLLRGSRVSGESRVITALRICCGKEEEGGKTSVTAFASFGKNQDRWTSSPLELNQCSRKTNNCRVEINPKKHFVHRKNLMITPSLKSSADKGKMSSSWNSCCHFDRVDNIWCKLRIGTCLWV